MDAFCWNSVRTENVHSTFPTNLENFHHSNSLMHKEISKPVKLLRDYLFGIYFENITVYMVWCWLHSFYSILRQLLFKHPLFVETNFVGCLFTHSMFLFIHTYYTSFCMWKSNLYFATKHLNEALWTEKCSLWAIDYGRLVFLTKFSDKLRTIFGCFCKEFWKLWEWNLKK